MSKSIAKPDLIRKRQRGEKITMLTAYDYPFAKIIDDSGIDIVLVGDSLGTVIQGEGTTLSVSLEEMIYHSRLVAKACSRAMVISDLPFMSYQLGAKEALESAGRLVKESGVAGVKLEGATETACDSIKRISEAGIPVMAHVGLTPQSYHQFGGYRVQGRSEDEADVLVQAAKRVERAGAFSTVLEGIPSELGKAITDALVIPTIGIGAGPDCSGQVLVIHDLLGLSDYGGYDKPKFVKEYATLRQNVQEAVAAFAEEVKSGEFPTSKFSYGSD